MRFLPRSLFGRLMLVLSAGLIVAQLLSATINLVERDRVLVTARGMQPAHRIADIVNLLDSLSPAERDRIVADVRAKIAESDRANLTAGQPASLFVDALPGETFVVKVGALSGLASRAQWYESATVTRLFDVTFQFDKPDPRLNARQSLDLAFRVAELLQQR